MRVALLVDSVGVGTYANLLGRFALGFVESDRVELTLVCYKDDPSPSWLPNAVDVRRLGTQRASRSLFALVRFLRREQPEFLLTRMVHQNFLGLAALALGRCAGWHGKLVVSHDHPAVLSHASHRVDNKWLAKIGYPFAAGVIANSPTVREDAIRWCALAPESVALVPLPIDSYTSADALAAPHRWLEPGQPPVFISTGRLVAYKRFELVIEAFAKVNAHRDVRLLIIGKGPEEEQLRAHVRALSLEGRAEVVGWVEDPRQWAACAWAFVLASNEEGFGQVLTEAMSVGCPVITVDSLGGGPAYVTDGGRYGVLVPREDVGALAKAMEAMLSGETRQRYVALGAARVEAFSPAQCASTLADFLDTLGSTSIRTGPHRPLRT